MSKQVYGPNIGTYLGKPIFETIQNDGVTYIFDRIADCDSDGCPLQQLSSNEMMLKSGLIYKKAS